MSYAEPTADGPHSYTIRIAGVADGGDRVPDLSPREASERWLNRLRGSRAESTVSSYHYRIKHFIEWCEAQRIDDVGELTGWDLESFETARRAEGLAITSLNNEMDTLKQFMEYCARVELVDEELPEKVEPPTVPKHKAVDDTRLTEPEAVQLLAYYEAEDYGSRAHALLLLAWQTGARKGALRGLDLGDYDRERGALSFRHRPDRGTPLKNGLDTERIVGITEVVQDVLNEYIREHRHDVYDDYGRRPLITSQGGRASKTTPTPWMYLATVPCLHSACPHGNDPAVCEFLDYSTASGCPSSRAPHQVRTGSITWQLNRGVPKDVVAKRVGTSVSMIERHYDVSTKREEFEERRAQWLDSLEIGDGDGE